MNCKKPTLIVDKKRCKKNIEKMVSKAKKNNLIFRPHFKTHQSSKIAELFKEYGINKCTVSSVEMAEYFAENGWKDITIAFPFNILEINEINKLLIRRQYICFLLSSIFNLWMLKITLNSLLIFY